METNDQPSRMLWSLKKKGSQKIYPSIPFATLKKWILEARIGPEDYLTNDSLSDWAKAKDLPELAPFFAADATGSQVLSRGKPLFGQLAPLEEDIELDMTPMIDVTFLLLIFFVVTATFAIHEVKSVKVPQAAHTKKEKQKNISISIDKANKIYLGKEEVSLEQLKDRVKDKVSQTQQRNVVLSADKEVQYGFLMQVLDTVNGTGLEDVHLKVEKKKN